MIIGAQLFTLRDYCKTTQDLDETLKKVADMGIKTVQLSGVCAYDPAWMAERLKEYGLTADITHFDINRITNETEATLKFHQTMNCPYIGIGCMPSEHMRPFTEEKLTAFFERVRPATKYFAEHGSKFMYHTHHFEFAMLDGKSVLARMLEEFPANEYGITFDVWWAQYTGENPVKWLYALEGRTDCVHFKDMSHNANGDIIMVPNGDGIMDYDAIIKACVDTGVKFGYIEQDNCNGEDPFACMKRSYDFFKSRGLN